MRSYQLAAAILAFVVCCVAQPTPELYVAAGHEPLGGVDAVFSPDGRLLATRQSHVYNVIKVWDVQTGEELRSINSPTLTTTDVVFLPDGKKFLWGNVINSLSLVDIETGTVTAGICPKEYTCGATVYAISSDGRVVATESQSRKEIEVFELESLRPIRKFRLASEVKKIALSGDGSLLSYFDEGRVNVMELSSGRVLFRIESLVSTPQFGFSGDRLVCRCSDATVSAWNGRSAAKSYERRWETGTVSSLQLLANGFFVTQDSLGKTKFWKADDGVETNSLNLNIGQATFSPIAMVYQQDNDDLVLFRYGEMKPSVLRNRAKTVSGLALGKNAGWIASGDYDSLRIWRIPGVGTPFSVPIGTPKGIAFDPVGKVSSPYADFRANKEMIGAWTAEGGITRTEIGGADSGTVGDYRDFSALSPDGKLLAWVTVRENRLRLIDTATGMDLPGPPSESRQIVSLRFSGDGSKLAYLLGKQEDGIPSQIRLMDVATRRIVGTIDLGNEVGFDGKSVPVTPSALAVSTRGDRVAVESYFNKILVLNAVSGARIATSVLEADKIVRNMRFTPDGRQVVSNALDGSLWLSDAEKSGNAEPFSGRLVKEANYIEFTSDGSFFGIGGGGRIVIFDFRLRREVVTLVAMPDDEWLAVTPDGRFDGSPGAFDAVKWRFSPSLYDIAPAEAFFSDFYYPGLLEDLFSGRMPAAVTSPATKDRRQPKVKVALDDGNFYRSTSTRTVRLRVKISEGPAGAKDLRLFRNGTLVKIWRGDLLTGRTSAEFETDVTVSEGDNKYTVYAFNSDNVKSREDSVWVVGEEPLRRKRVAYILAIGVNKYENREFDLSYAATDAASFADAFGKAQTASGEFDRVELTSLSDALATKSTIAAALREIAGKAQPEDEVAIFFAGHGLAQGDRFYLIPHDLGYTGRRNQLGAEGLKTITASSISDVELEALLEPVSAERLFMVIDACNSGQALESEEKRRGPMNSRGLAQLAYEKGMYILTASQSYQLATESSQLGHGYLTYALIEDGLKSSRADRSPADGKITMREWFDYAVDRVPRIFTSEQARKRQLTREDGKTPPAVRDGSGQVPRVFYRREQDRKPWLVTSLVNR